MGWIIWIKIVLSVYKGWVWGWQSCNEGQWYPWRTLDMMIFIGHCMSNLDRLWAHWFGSSCSEWPPPQSSVGKYFGPRWTGWWIDIRDVSDPRIDNLGGCSQNWDWRWCCLRRQSHICSTCRLEKMGYFLKIQSRILLPRSHICTSLSAQLYFQTHYNSYGITIISHRKCQRNHLTSNPRMLWNKFSASPTYKMITKTHDMK